MKKIFLLLTIWSLLLLNFSELCAFTDKEELEAANRLAYNNFIKNYSDNIENYRTKDNITRKEAMKIVASVWWLDLKSTCEWKFSDVPYDWSCKYIEAMLNAGYIADADYFRPNDNITMSEVLKIVFKIAKIDKKYNTWYWQRDYFRTALDLWIIEQVPMSPNYSAKRWWVFVVISKAMADKIEANNTTTTNNNNTNTNTGEEIVDTKYYIFWCANWTCNEKIDLSKEYTSKEVLIKYNNSEIKAFITKPAWKTMKLVLLFHGTSFTDEESEKYAKSMPETIGATTYLKDYFIVSVAFKETDVAIWDEVKESEKAFLLFKNYKTLQNFTREKLFLLWHSRWGYIVNMINTKHQSDWVIVNWTGPLDIWETCENLFNGTDSAQPWLKTFCSETIVWKYWEISENKDVYDDLAIKTHICESKSPIIFIQGDQDKERQVTWMKELENVMESSNCNIDYEVVWVTWATHWGTFKEEFVWNKIVNFFK